MNKEELVRDIELIENNKSNKLFIENILRSWIRNCGSAFYFPIISGDLCGSILQVCGASLMLDNIPLHNHIDNVVMNAYEYILEKFLNSVQSKS